MSKIVMTEYLTLDGVFEEPGNWSLPYFNDEAATFKFDEIFASDALLLGRRTYEGFAAAWPAMEDEQGFADRMNTIPKYVVSTTMEEAGWNNSIVISENVIEEVARLKQQAGKDILLSGSAELVNSLMPSGLIDEYRLMVHPIVLGTGKRLFKDGIDTANLKLVDTKSTCTGVVILTYQPAEKNRDA
jgi:dihydrofolate reductase